MTSAYDLPDDTTPALLAMALVAEGKAPDTAYGKAFQLMLEKDAVGFAKKHSDLEMAFWQGRAAQESGPAAVAWDHKGPCPTCGHEKVQDVGTEHCVAVAEQWLRENA